jgi:hypothetical protein
MDHSDYKHERDMLAKHIAAAAIKCGILRPDIQGLSGPQLLMLCDDMASAASTQGLQAEIDRLNAIINTPQSNDFLRAVSTEAEHQRQRWGSDHDSGKTPADWFWLVGYLAGKALHAHAASDLTKAEHHVITAAAALANWHLAMFGNTDMRPGIDGESLLTSPTTGAVR